MAMILVTGPAVEPLTVADVAAQLRLDSLNQEPAPATAPGAALAGLGAGNVDAGAHRWAVSFVTADGETPPGPMSAPVTVVTPSANGQVALTAIPTGGQAVTSRKLWRTLAGGTILFLLATVSDNATTAYVDNTADANLGVQAPSVNTTTDPQITRWIKSARHSVEGFTDRALITQTWQHVADVWPWVDGFFDLPANLQSVTAIQYTDITGASQTLATTVYLTTAPSGPRSERGRITLKYAQYWPPVLVQRDVITVTMKLGYGDTAASVPDDIKAAMLLMISTWYEERQDQTIIRGTADQLPRNAERMLRRYQAGPITRQAVTW